LESPIEVPDAEKSLAAGIANAEIAMTITRVDRLERSVIHVQGPVQDAMRQSQHTIRRFYKNHIHAHRCELPKSSSFIDEADLLSKISFA
jgi:hypothetical protein